MIVTWKCLKKLDQPFMYVVTQLFFNFQNAYINILFYNRKSNKIYQELKWYRLLYCVHQETRHVCVCAHEIL